MKSKKNFSSEDIFKNQEYNTEKDKNDIEFIIKSLKKLKDRIFKNSLSIDNINEYFDHLLSYNIFRSENIIYPDDFERVIQLEQLPFTVAEISKIFDFLDSKKDGFIDRMEFINSIKNVPHPISTIQNYIINNNLSIVDLAYKMEIELYKIPIDDILNIKLNELQFQGNMKLINSNYSREFSSGLFNSIGGGSIYITIGQIFDVFNIKKDESYKELYKKRDEIFNACLEGILSSTTYFELKQKLTSVDKLLTGKIPLNQFMSIMKKIINGKISDIYLLHLLRMYKYIDKENNVDYHSFILLLYLNGDDSLMAWYKCLEIFMKFLKEE
jgi:Ca2+-binding EF-hand superfamily protein